MDELPIHLKQGSFMDIMKEAQDFDRNSLVYKSTFIALVDILGYKNLLDEFGKEAPKRLFEDILNAFAWARSSHESIKISLFSDTIIMEGINEHPMNFWNMVQIISSLKLQLLQSGLTIRGAIAFGDHFSQKGILVSPALIEAHLLESKSAVHPRIIISAVAMSRANEGLMRKDDVEGLIIEKYFCAVQKRMIVKDADGWFSVAFDPNMVELRYLKYGEHPDKMQMGGHIEHCINAGNMVLERLFNGIKKAKQNASSEKAKAKIEYVINEWNSYIESFKFRDKFKVSYHIELN